jgi:ATP phosphoribosyltransferase
MVREDIRLALPSKGRLEPETLAFLEASGLGVYKPNPRQYQARLPAVPAVNVLFQRPGDIAVGVRQGSLDFGITGYDVVAEKQGDNCDILIIHDSLGFGRCHLALAVPENWEDVQSVADLAANQARLAAGRGALRVATRFPRLTAAFLDRQGIEPVNLIDSEGTLEVAPAIGYADLIADLVSTGTTLRDNRLRPLPDGVILQSQAVLIANRRALRERPEVRQVAHDLLEYVEAHLRAGEHSLVLVNMRGESAEAIAGRMFTQTRLAGLQGPTIAPVFNPQAHAEPWFAVTIVVRKDRLTEAIAELRRIGGSGVVVTPVTYIFEEEPVRYRQLLKALEE